MIRFTSILLLLSATAPLWSQEEEEENVLPQGYPLTRYTSEWENSAFNRVVLKIAATTIRSNFGQSLALEGMVNDDIKGHIAYVKDLKENKSYVITTEKNSSHPFLIVSANQQNDPRETKVTITDGNETAEIGYPDNSITKKIDQPQPAVTEKEGDRKTAGTTPAPGASKSGSRGGPPPGAFAQKGKGTSAFPPGVTPPNQDSPNPNGNAPPGAGKAESSGPPGVDANFSPPVPKR